MPTPIAGPAIGPTTAVGFEFEPVDDVNGQTADLLSPDAGNTATLGWDMWAARPRTLTSLRLIDDDAADFSAAAQLRVWTVDQTDTRLFSLGHFHYTAAPKTVALGETARVCALADSSILLDAPLPYAVSYPGGIRVTDAITDLVDLVPWPLGFDVTAAAARFVDPVGWRAGASIGDAIAQLCTQAGMFPPLFDRDGHGRIEPAADPDESLTPDYDFDADPAVTDAGYSESDDLLDSPNTWVATSQAGASGSYTLPAAAPGSVTNRGGVVVVALVDAPGADSTVACELAARTAALAAPGATRTRTFAGIPDFSHDLLETVRFDGEIWREQAWSVPLTAGGPMGHVLRRPY